MASLNKVMLIGNLGKDPEVRYTTSGAAVASFSVATTEKFKNKSGEWEEKTEWHNVTLWAYEPELAEEMTHDRVNRLFLPGINLSPRLRFTNSLPEAVAGKDPRDSTSIDAPVPDYAAAIDQGLVQGDDLMAVRDALDHGGFQRPDVECGLAVGLVGLIQFSAGQRAFNQIFENRVVSTGSAVSVVEATLAVPLQAGHRSRIASSSPASISTIST